MSVDERMDMERQYRDQESGQGRLAGRSKFSWCMMCGSADGMQATPREVLVQLDAEAIAQLAPWYREPGNSEYLFHACDSCNQQGIVPTGYERVRIIDISDWLDNTSLMQPDYAALAAEPEPVLASRDSRESAGLEG